MDQTEVRAYTVDELKKSLGALKLMNEQRQQIRYRRSSIQHLICDYGNSQIISNRALLYLRQTIEQYDATMDLLRRVRITIMNLLPKLLPSEPRDKLLLSHVDTLGLSVRHKNVLGGQLNIELLGELVQYQPDELLEQKNFEETSLRETQSALEQKGWKLGEGATWKNAV